MSRLSFIRAGLAVVAAPVLATAVVPAAQAAAFDSPVASAYHEKSVAHGRDRYDRYDRYGRGDRYGRYDDRYRSRDYRGDRLRHDSRVWRGRDGRYYCQKDNGTTGLLIGGAVGGLIGNEIARDRTLGAIVGAAGGALLGRQIDRSNARCR